MTNIERSKIFGSQASLRVHCYKRHEV